MNSKRLGLLTATTVLGVAAPSHAQGVATVRELVRVVKIAPAGTAALSDAKVGMTIAAGSRVRTGGRSKAGLRFPDQSLLRIDELTEVLVTSPAQRNARVLRGHVFANYRAPGSISGGQAVAAVRGTELELIVGEGEDAPTVVRCYEGQVFVSKATNPIFAGVTGEVTGTTLADASLRRSLVAATGIHIASNQPGQMTDVQAAESLVDWRGGEIRFTDGPYAGQNRKVTDFDARTGKVTFAPALEKPAITTVGASGFLLVQQPNEPVVVLGPNQGTTVPRVGNPSPPYRVPIKAFAGGQRNPPLRRVASGSTLTFPGQSEHFEVQTEVLAQRQATQQVVDQQLMPGAPDTPPGPAPGPNPPPDPDEDCDFEPPFKTRLRQALSCSNKTHHHAKQNALLASALGQELQVSSRGSAQQVTQGLRRQFAQAGRDPAIRDVNPTPGRLLAPQPGGSTQARGARVFSFPIEPFAIGSNVGEAVGIRTRVQAVQGEFFVEAGYRFGLFSGTHNHDVSEGFVHYRGKRGEVVAGRQHLFISPANNNDLGVLLAFETADAIVYEAPVPAGYRALVGYVFDSRAIQRNGENGFFHHALMPALSGNVGYSLFKSSDRASQLGYSFQTSQGVLPNKVDAYGEIGKSTHGKFIATGGLYFPGLFHRFGVDLFTEYAKRERIDERFSVRVRKSLGGGLMLIGFVDKQLRGNGSVVGGGGLQYSITFR